ncbi:coiled-coil domain-containing protein 25 [Piptocephalis cylindrospora]|uniref:Coiled-coil domain-containing protein 25 n=1 Tax=Piptocephalis cylindrospora TaxID=1907219 RepID=A0A4P9Y7N4_9FUNG|nr:coiled-coil domain-containing protein 25 [Piptocephalis cylindrospora]|eukprot:RKP15157.1 coiled-coil domain-containing protein 25 [Piptocephalis cylindrospora]
MVFYFTSNVVDPASQVYMGKDKVENEDLIRYGWEEDFHVDKLSSAHVYLRLSEDQTWDNIPEALVQDMAQLTKANSIEGSKKNNICIIYTPWSNLRKTGDMAVGQVSFHNPKLVKRTYVEKKDRDILLRLNKTKEESYPDLQAQRDERDRQVRLAQRKAQAEKTRDEQRKKEEWKAEKEARSYDSLFDTEVMKTNRDWQSPEDAEDDFM